MTFSDDHMAATGKVKRKTDLPQGVERLKEEHKKVVNDCRSQIEHWEKVEKDYESLQGRLRMLPDKLSYDITVPFGPLAFMPGKLVHTNELTVLLGDNWFAKCSAKQADALVEHRKTHVKQTLDELQKVMKNFQNRASFTDDLEKLACGTGDFIDIKEEVLNEDEVNKGKHRLAHKPNSKPKQEFIVKLEEEQEKEEEAGDDRKAAVLSEEELWARLDELERQEELQDQRYRLNSTDTNGEDTTSSSEEEKEGEAAAEVEVNGHEKESGLEASSLTPQMNGSGSHSDEEHDDEEEEMVNSLPTIYFTHTAELKKVRINIGKNTTLKFSERKEQKEQAKQKKKNGRSNGHSSESFKIKSPADIYRVFVDLVNGEPMPRKSILKSRSRENSVCSDTSESSAADFEERRAAFGRSWSHDDTTYSDTSDGITEEDSPTGVSPHTNGRFEAFTGTVVEKDPLPCSIPHLTIATPALPTIPERKLEEQGTEVPQELPKRMSKFKATRLHQK
ncbi:hypothetical protein DNTS_009269 [Danionella cerebrum]|uniref:Protein phosphatase 1 regulatory subunit 19 n=1 Tax=Danionella cerebrum TaxID=2873325 RepID=A0A553Q5M0_9TELE|nr:hypothetical protein DNTS_009269 [Danionella translucida]